MANRLKNPIVTFDRGLKEIEKENGSCQHWNQVYCEARVGAGGKGRGRRLTFTPMTSLCRNREPACTERRLRARGFR